MRPTLIIDADPIVYGAGFAAQSTTHDYVVEDKDGNLVQQAFDDGNAARKWVKDNGYTVLSHEAHVDVKDEGFARQAAKTQLSGIVNAAKEKLSVGDELNVEVYLSGQDNFRYKLATIVPYKADRPPPPVHYQVVRNYLTERWNAIVVHGIEADDRVSIRCRELAADRTPFVLATIDKDLDQVPGLHYGYKAHVFYDVDPFEAELYFWQQVISGDSTDNIQGCFKIGAAKARKLLDQWAGDFAAINKDPLEDGESAREWREFVWSAILNTYYQNMSTFPEKFPKGMLASAAALENARLVFMLEYEGQLWNPPGVPHGELSSLAAV
jgi:hypothetical protein